MSNGARTLYVGVTNDIERRVYQHKHRLTSSLTAKYKIDRLVYFEETSDVHEALAREKQIKDWRRAKKVALIESVNPTWRDLSLEWYSSARGDQSVDSSLRSE